MGVGVHPHRGFETVTIAYKGKVEHHDSYGGGGIIGEGDVQWMTAAIGILHKEFHEKEWSEQAGLFQMVQLWINLPARFKMGHPRYQAIHNSEMVKVELPGNAGVVEVVAGEYEGKKGPASTFSPVNLMNVRLNKGGKAEFTFPAVMSGEPLNEPIVAHGPFVMNTKREIIQAFDDFNQGKFGYLKD